MKSFFQNILASFISLFVLFLLGEIGCRIYYASHGPRTVDLDDKLGWDLVHNLQKTETKKDFAQKSYICTYTIDSLGFRAFGNVHTMKPKIFFVGDSFTLAEDATDDSTYYKIVAQHTNTEVFAYGVGGYGTLQEYMLLEKYIDLVKPNEVIVQATTNDFINNDYDLEYRSVQNNGTCRPFLTLDDKIVYKFPKNLPKIRDFANRYSRFLYFIFTRIDKAFRKVEYNFQEKDYTKSYQVTRLAFQRIKKLCDSRGVSLSSFLVNDANSIEAKMYEKILQEVGITPIANVPVAIEQAEKKGICCKALDGGHWNHTGHRICGQLLAEKIKQIL